MKSAASSHGQCKINNQRLQPSKSPLKNSIISQQNCSDGEDEFSLLIEQIQQSSFFKSLSRHARIKLESWMEILMRVEYNPVWKSNKLNYLRLLSLMCQCERLVEPFTAFPKQQDTLPFLQRHELSRIIDQVEKEVRNSKLTTKRHNNPAADSAQTKNRRKNSRSQQNKSAKGNHYSKSFDGKQNIKNKEKKNEGQFRGDTMTRKKNRFQLNYQAPIMSNFSPQTKRDTIFSRTEQFMPSFVRYSKNTNLPAFQHDSQEKNLSKLNSNENSGYLSRSRRQHKYQNSISDSVNLQLSPVSVSSKVWQFTHKKRSKHQMMNHTFDLSKMVRRTIDSSKHPRLANPLRLFVPAEDDYSTGEALKVPNKQYWESNSYTGNATPKYLSSFKQIGNLSFTQSENYEPFMSQEKDCCSCYYPLWNS